MGERGKRLRPCHVCGIPVSFVHWPGKAMNIFHWANEDGSHHVHGGKAGRREQVLSERQKPGPVRVMHGQAIVGRDYKPSGCDCNVPPWEVCPHSFPWAMDTNYDPAPEWRERFL